MTSRSASRAPASSCSTARSTRSSRAPPTAADLDDRHDILSLLLRTRTEDGETLTDRELRDELLTLVLAGHETTANSLAWTWERLVRNAAAYDRLRDAVRSGRAGRRARRGGDRRGHAQPPGDPDGRPARDGAVAPGRLRGAGGHAGLDERPAPAPPRGPLSGPVRLPARALARPQAGHLRVDPVRRRHPPLPGRRACDGRAARRPARR